jgi:primosomal protein N' (replication factor Y)
LLTARKILNYGNILSLKAVVDRRIKYYYILSMSESVSSKSKTQYAKFALPLPLYCNFDYRIADNQPAKPGIRFRLPFGSRDKIGIMLAAQEQAHIEESKIKTTFDAIDHSPVLSSHILELAKWMADYYLQPGGEVLFQCLPKYLRKANAQQETRIKVWQSIALDKQARQAIKERSARQQELLEAIEESSSGLNAAELKSINPGWHRVIMGLETKGAVTWHWAGVKTLPMARHPGPVLSTQQSSVVDSIGAQQDRFAVHLIDGITGSGKTEVYFKLIEQQLANDRQIIYLVPEIGLTSQLVARVQQRFGEQFAISHSGLSDLKRYQAWQRFRNGDVSIMLGTRSSLFSQSDKLGLIIIDEEHDESYKQDDGIRYHARDVAIKRAQMLDIPIVLGSATPSMESINNSAREHFYVHRLDKRPGGYPPPPLRLIDLRHAALDTGCSPYLLERIDQNLNNGGQVLLYLNRRGFAPVVMCHACNWQAHCVQCDARLTLHQSLNRLLCHHCGYALPQPDSCPECNNTSIRHYGIGTQQLEQRLAELFPTVPLLRIDRDAVSGHSAFAERLKILQKGDPCILIGTQMIAKGHDYPGITMSAILDADQALFSSSYRATEQLIQTAFQVSGRSGRGQKQGEAWIQTRFPEHPLMQDLLKKNYREIATGILKERKLLGFPPFARVIIFRADGFTLELAMNKLEEIRVHLNPLSTQPDIHCIGPMPALMTRRVGRYRAQLCLISNNLRELRVSLRTVMPTIQKISSSSKVKWTIDVDAYDL